MNDTRETIHKGFPKKEDVPPCRFKCGDEVIHPLRLDLIQIIPEPFFDSEFGGWMLSPGCIGVHESNYILASDVDNWMPVVDGLWSYWTRRTGGSDA